jgi:cyanamide hydratase
LKSSYVLGLALLKIFPRQLDGVKDTQGLIETFFLSCLLHDIGTVPSNIKATRLSFELWGAIKARSLLSEYGAHPDQVDLVAETINRHQDLGETGMVPAVLALIYFGTLFGML